jgi:hypothetical protein
VIWPADHKPRKGLAGASDGGKVDREMKKIQIVGLALVAVFAFGALLASAASAEPTLLAEWLILGSPVTVLTLYEKSSGFRIGDTSNGSSLECSSSTVGSVGPNGEDELTEILSLGGTTVTLSNPLLCESNAVCEKSATDVEVAPEDLPWHLLVFLMESNGTFLDEWISGGYSSSCLVLGLRITDECTFTDAVGEVSNVTGGVESAEEALTPLGTCSIGGAGTGEFVPQKGNLMTIPGGGPLTVSSGP